MLKVNSILYIEEAFEKISCLTGHTYFQHTPAARSTHKCTLINTTPEKNHKLRLSSFKLTTLFKGADSTYHNNTDGKIWQPNNNSS